MNFLFYFFKVNIAVLIFYGFYRAFFRQDTFFRWKRAALMAILFISILYPFIETEWLFADHYRWQNTIPNGGFLPYILPEIMVSRQADGQSVSFIRRLPQLVTALYGIGIATLFLRALIQTGTIIRIVRRSQPAALYGQTVYCNPDIQTPFSFFRWIVLNSKRYTDTELQEILRHEETHVRQTHSVDILLAELFCIFCWLNPFAWLLKREIRMNLEFLADQSVLASGYEAEHYQFHLLRLTYRKATANIVNNFNVSLLKKRIFMMNKKQTSKLSICKYTLLIPVVGALVFFNNALNTQAGTVNGVEPIVTVEMPEILPEMEILVQETIVPPVKTPSEKVSATSPQPPAKEESEQPIFSHVEQMPAFPGGEKAMMQWLFDNIQYPVAAQEQKIQGRVIVRFVIGPDGTVKAPEIVRSLHPICDEEALRVIRLMPKWLPGKQNGQPISVYYYLPIMFKMPDTNTEEKPANIPAQAAPTTERTDSDN
ncbi:MAG: TonB family protein [Dysgonamonadaceae bacterium]|jgi:TonB family protein|nr:TonB family protein [Dysgonamonadaceae bacterium]